MSEIYTLRVEMIGVEIDLKKYNTSIDIMKISSFLSRATFYAYYH